MDFPSQETDSVEHVWTSRTGRNSNELSLISQRTGKATWMRKLNREDGKIVRGIRTSQGEARGACFTQQQLITQTVPQSSKKEIYIFSTVPWRDCIHANIAPRTFKRSKYKKQLRDLSLTLVFCTVWQIILWKFHVNESCRSGSVTFTIV